YRWSARSLWLPQLGVQEFKVKTAPYKREGFGRCLCPRRRCLEDPPSYHQQRASAASTGNETISVSSRAAMLVLELQVFHAGACGTPVHVVGSLISCLVFATIGRYESDANPIPSRPADPLCWPPDHRRRACRHGGSDLRQAQGTRRSSDRKNQQDRRHRV